jgi:TPR repeat protein
MAADQGHAAAQYQVGIHYLHVDDIEQSRQEAIKYLQKAAEQGVIGYQFRLGYELINSDFLEEQTKGFSQLKKIADQGDCNSQEIIVECYRKGRGIAPSVSESAK